MNDELIKQISSLHSDLGWIGFMLFLIAMALIFRKFHK